MTMTRCPVVPLAFAAVLLMRAHAALAQPGTAHLEAGGHFASAAANEFDSTDSGFGGRIGWQPLDGVGVEAELTLFPADFPGDRGFSRGRVEALFGATAGPRLGRMRPFVKFRPGLVRFRPASQPLACILIFPPPLSCELAGGRTLFAADIGGGVDVVAAERAFVRFDLSDRMVRYPGPVFDRRQTIRDSAFFSHGLRVAAGAGIRF